MHVDIGLPAQRIELAGKALALCRMGDSDEVVDVTQRAGLLAAEDGDAVITVAGWLAIDHEGGHALARGRIAGAAHPAPQLAREAADAEDH